MFKKYLLFALAIGLISFGTQAVTAQQVQTFPDNQRYTTQQQPERFGQLITIYGPDNIVPMQINVPRRGLLELSISNATDTDYTIQIPLLNREEEVDAGETDVITLNLMETPARNIAFNVMHEDMLLSRGQIVVQEPTTGIVTGPPMQQQQQMQQPMQQPVTTTEEVRTGGFVRGYW